MFEVLCVCVSVFRGFFPFFCCTYSVQVQEVLTAEMGVNCIKWKDLVKAFHSLFIERKTFITLCKLPVPIELCRLFLFLSFFYFLMVDPV